MQSKDKITVTNPMKIGQPSIVTEDYDQNGWKFIFKKSGILPSKEIDQLADDLHLQGIPDVIYGNSIAQLVFEGKNFVYEISPKDSLSFINIAKQKAKYQENFDKTFDTETINVLTPELKIKQAEFWKNKKVAEGTEIKTLEKISDWTYSTPYKGTARQFKASESANQDITTGIENLSLNPKQEISIEKTEEEIPLNNLTANNPIKWFNEFLLFEDELGDCGLSQSTFRFRVMGDCFFGLVRHYLRVDDVCVRIYDTRLYHDFGKNYILREFTVRENTFDELKHKGFKFGAEFITNHRQSDVIYPSLELTSTFRDKVFF